MINKNMKIIAIKKLIKTMGLNKILIKVFSIRKIMLSEVLLI